MPAGLELNTNVALVLVGVVYALTQILSKVMDWKIGERRRGGSSGGSSGDTTRLHDLDDRMANLETMVRSMRTAQSELTSLINTLLFQLTNAGTALDNHAEHMRKTLHAIANALNPIAGWIKELRDERSGG